MRECVRENENTDRQRGERRQDTFIGLERQEEENEKNYIAWGKGTKEIARGGGKIFDCE